MAQSQAQSIFTPLYLANYFVDQVQDAKTKVVDTFVWDDKVKKTAKDFVEAQKSRSASLVYRKKLKEHQDKVNYTNEIQRIRC